MLPNPIPRGSRAAPARSRASRASVVALCLAAAFSGLAAGGCRVNEEDIHRWESTAHGPDKLRAVLYYDKYDTNLRVEAALSLIRMKPRAGRRIGINIMVDTLASIAPEARQAIVASLIPAIIAELKKPPPAAQAGQASPPDASFAYKDAAFAALTHDGTVIISDEGLKQTLKTTLVEWAMADFEHRLENRTQAYGMEQLLRFIGPAAVVGLPKLMTRDAQRLDQMAGLAAELGDDKTKTAASAALVSIAQWIVSDDWLKVKKPELHGQEPPVQARADARPVQGAARPVAGRGAHPPLRVDAQGGSAPHHRLLPRLRREEGSERQASPGGARRAGGAPRPQQP